MPQLGNIRHERFARLVAKGQPKVRAYALAGYTWNRGNAIALWKHKGKASQNIQRRVGELMKASAQLSAQDILDHVYSVFDLAMESGQCSAALKACEMLGKERGLFRDRRENININLDSMSWDQQRDYLLDRYGDRAQRLIAFIGEHYNTGNNTKDNTVTDISHNGAICGVAPNTNAPYLVVDNEDCDI